MTIQHCPAQARRFISSAILPAQSGPHRTPASRTRMCDCRPVSTNAFQAQDSQLTFEPICPPVQCAVPSLDGHYLYAKFKPRPCAPSLSRPILHCGMYCGRQRLLSSGLQRRCHIVGLYGPTHLAPSQRVPWDTKNVNFMAPYPRLLPVRGQADRQTNKYIRT